MTDYFIVTFSFSNACLNSVEHNIFSLNKKLKEQTCDFNFQIIDGATMAFLWFAISHQYGSGIEVNSDLVARKSIKILKRSQKILLCKKL